MSESNNYSVNKQPVSPGSGTFLITICCLVILLFSSLASAVTVRSGPTLTLDPNGLTPLAAVLQLETDLPARVTLYVTDGKEQRTIEFAEFRTDFSLPLLGLKPDKAYTVEVKLTDRNNRQVTLTPSLRVATDPLPDDFPDIKLNVSEPALMEPGYTMMARFIRARPEKKFALKRLRSLLRDTFWDWTCWAIDWSEDYCTDTTAPTYTIIVDDRGDVVWYSTLGDSVNYQLEDGTLLYWGDSDVITIDMLGNEIRRITLDDPGTRLTHDVFPTIDQTYLSATIQQATIQNFPSSHTDPQAERITATVEDNPILEFNSEGNVLNIWPLVDLLDTTRIGYYSLNQRPLGFDWAHMNSVVHDPRDNSIVISLRHQDALVKFSRSTGELKWILGPHANWSSKFQPFLLTPAGEPFEWQYHQHAAEITPSGTILVFDNGNTRASPFDGKTKTPPGINYSRAVEYAIDEQNMEVRQVWEYGKNIAKPLYAGHLGDANSLKKTGNVLITFGAVSFTGGVRNSELGLGALSTRIIEVTHDTPAKKVFDMLVYDPGRRARIQVYRSERIPDLYPVDTDADGIPDYRDNCKLAPNGPLIPGDAVNSQLNTDGDDAGDMCDDDDDNDGMTDNYEVENQLDPLDPTDAGLDRDGNGMSNLEEFRLAGPAAHADTDSNAAEDMPAHSPAARRTLHAPGQAGP